MNENIFLLEMGILAVLFIAAAFWLAAVFYGFSRHYYNRPCLIALGLIPCFFIGLFFRLTEPYRSFSDEQFGITTYVSSHDEDGDGIDDQTDIVRGAYAYIETGPKYKSKYYESGYPDDGYGVCTDVVAQGMKEAGYDLMELVDGDILAEPQDYGITEPDKKIDFRRVRNLKVYFGHTAISLTTDIRETEEWQAGDIVIWQNHIGIVADKRNRRGIPYIIHHANPFQPEYVEDVLEIWGTVTGHYRIS